MHLSNRLAESDNNADDSRYCRQHRQYFQQLFPTSLSSCGTDTQNIHRRYGVNSILTNLIY